MRIGYGLSTVYAIKFWVQPPTFIRDRTPELDSVNPRGNLNKGTEDPSSGTKKSGRKISTNQSKVEKRKPKVTNTPASLLMHRAQQWKVSLTFPGTEKVSQNTVISISAQAKATSRFLYLLYYTYTTIM